jgi:hypothetical protein
MGEHLFLALSTKGYGETLLGLQIAERLAALGDRSTFLAHPSSMPLLAGSGFAASAIGDHVGGLLELYVDQLVARRELASIVLADYFTTDLWLQHHGLSPALLGKHGVPLIAIDTWALARTGTAVDIYWRKQRTVADWSSELDLLLQPVPIAPLDAGDGAYSCLPEPASTSDATRRALRASLGIAPSSPVILFCTALWQQTRYSCPHADRLSRAVPRLLERSLRELDARAHLVHVGPEPYPFDLDGRYRWLAPQPRERFAAILGGADLLLTANVSATTISKALVSGVPVVAVVNSHEVADASRAEGLPFLDEVSRAWLAEAAPLYPFAMWPVGYFRYLEPLLRRNPYLDAIRTVELLERRRVIDTIDRLLLDPAERSRAIERQLRYVEEVRRLPGVERRILAATSGAGAGGTR